MKDFSLETQNEMVQSEIENLWDVLSEVPENKMQVVSRLIERVAFMTVTLQVLEQNIKTNGPTYFMKQGQQGIYVENPAQKSYNAMINRYTAAYSKLIDLLPEENAEENDGFDAFVSKK